MDADRHACLAVSNAVQANGVGDTIEQFIYENKTGAAQPVQARRRRAGHLVGRHGPAAGPAVARLTAGVRRVDPPDRAGSLNPDSNYLGFATSAGAVNASVSVDPATIPLESYSAAGPVQMCPTTQCAAARRAVQGRRRRGRATFAAPTWAAADGVSVSGAGGFGSGTCPTTVHGPCRFFGTSAAAPTAAGVAALIREEFGGKISPINAQRRSWRRGRSTATDCIRSGGAQRPLTSTPGGPSLACPGSRLRRPSLLEHHAEARPLRIRAASSFSGSRSKARCRRSRAMDLLLVV